MDTTNNFTVKKAVKSSSYKAFGKMFFFDIYRSSNDKPYLKITESRFAKEGQEQPRKNVFILFPEEVSVFGERINEMYQAMQP